MGGVIECVRAYRIIFVDYMTEKNKMRQDERYDTRVVRK